MVLARYTRHLRMSLVGALLSLASWTAFCQDAAPVQQFLFGKGIPATAPDNEIPVSVVGISDAPDGTIIASVLTDRDNVAIIEYQDGAWTFQDFVTTVTKSPWHSYAVEMTGRVFTDNGVPEGTPLLASSLMPDGRHYSATAAGIWDDTISPSVLIHPMEAPALSIAGGPNGAVAFGTATGLFHRADAASPFAPLTPNDVTRVWPPTNVDVVAFDATGRLWFGSDEGAGVWDGAAWKLYAASDGLPTADFTGVAAGAGNVVWFGTPTGLLRLNGGWVQFAGPTWLPNDHVNALAVDEAGAAWVATNAGISRIDAAASPEAAPVVPPPAPAAPETTPAPVPASAPAPAAAEAKFLQDRATRFVPGDPMPAQSVGNETFDNFNGIAIAPDGTVVVSTTTNLTNVALLEYASGVWITGQFADLITKSNAHNYAAVRTGKISRQMNPDRQLLAQVYGQEGRTYVTTSDGLWMFSADPASPGTQLLPLDRPPLCVAAGPAGALAIGTADALYYRPTETAAFEEVRPADARYSWDLRNVTAVAFDAQGRLWFGCDLGAGVWDGSAWQLFTGAEGLPYDHFTCAAAAPDGTIWFGTERGAMVFDGTEWAYRASLRWLPNDYVNDIAIAADGTAWIATKGGVARIQRVPMTLSEKAAHFEEQVESRHTWKDFVSAAHLEQPGKVETARRQIDDNDGMYTSLHGSAEAFRYAVTKDPVAKDSARRRFGACKWLVDITGNPGFPARLIVPIDWHEDLNAQYGDAYNQAKLAEDPFWKLITPRFVTSADGQYLWKNDTSSDELAGHYFFYSVYYDHVAETEEEKAPVREVVAAITDHLIRNGFELVDVDGKPTRWGRFSPEFMNSVFGWEQRGLNSMMMLSFLNVASHITGDPKYGEAAKMLRDEHDYHINAMLAKMYFPPGYVVPWDNNLALLSFYGLIMYENDPALLLMYRQSLEFAWQHVSKQKNALWNILYGACAKRFQEVADTGLYAAGTVFPEAGPYAQTFAMDRMYAFDPFAQDAIDMLMDLPLELIGWKMENTHRLDIMLDPQPGQSADMGWSRVTGKAISIAERSHVRQDRDAFKLNASEGDGSSEHEGTFFLLPYYMGRYYGFVE